MKNRFFSLLEFAEALLISAVVRLVVRFFSPSIRLYWMGKPVDLQTTLPEPNAAQELILRSVKIAIVRSTRYAPWNTECYTQALTARIMLRRRQVPLLMFIGFKKEEGQLLQGHAWTTCGTYILTGYRIDLSSYILNGCFL